MRWVEEMKFNRLGVFTYSHEENTHAYGLVDDVPDEEKRRRADEIMDVQSEIAWEHNQQMVDKTYKVLIDREEGGMFYGRTEYDSPEVDNEVIFTDDRKLTIGEFVNTKIVKADYFDLYGKAE